MNNAEKLTTLCITTMLLGGLLCFAYAQDPNVPSSTKNIQSAGLLAQPFTVLDFFVHRLSQDADQVARNSEERKTKYRRTKVDHGDETTVACDPFNNRIRLILGI